jgi:hypothetical protein
MVMPPDYSGGITIWQRNSRTERLRHELGKAKPRKGANLCGVSVFNPYPTRIKQCMKYSINKEVRKMFELFAKYAALRRMFYALLLMAAYWRLPEILAVLK